MGTQGSCFAWRKERELFTLFLLWVHIAAVVGSSSSAAATNRPANYGG